MCALPHDRDNLVLAMTCRMNNPKIRIVAKCHDIKLSQRIKTAGADSVVSPQFIRGMRLVSEMVRPTVVSFLDLMLRDRDKGMRVEEVRVQTGSALAGKPLTDRAVADTDVLILAIQAPGEQTFAYGPSSGSVLAAGCTMIILGSAASVNAVREKAGAGI
ncbi:MAG: hypothetical protein EXR96_02255 [Nitrospiraceae bacterium]|nr:hypothetical protein [Nitrospiraceae bacterium]